MVDALIRSMKGEEKENGSRVWRLGGLVENCKRKLVANK